MSDGWTNSITGNRHLSFKLKTLNDLFHWTSYVAREKTANLIYSETDKIVKDLHEKDAIVVSDVAEKAAKMQKALRDLHDEHPRTVTFGGTVHLLNIFVGGVFKKIPNAGLGIQKKHEFVISGELPK